MKEMMVRKLWVLIGLCAVFGLVLFLVYVLAQERLSYDLLAQGRLGHPLRLSPPSEADYRMVMRCLKYGLLLTVLVYTVFFLCELLQGWRIHPMQYLLVGAGLAVFYLLLLAFSEQIGFAAAYGLGAAACIALLVWYLGYVLPARRGVWGMAALLAGAYGAMYVLVCLAQYNLLLGSCLLFAAVFAVMFCTRHVDWYRIGEAE